MKRANKQKDVKLDEDKISDITETKEEDADDVNPAESSLLIKMSRRGLVDVGNSEVNIQRRNPNSPLFSIKTFEELNLKPELLQGVRAMGFHAPSTIQEVVLPILLADPPKNIIAQSQSGTGKTAAFVLAMLSRVEAKSKYPQVVCLAPTYELAIQIGEEVAKMSRFCQNIRIRLAVSGEDVSSMKKFREHIIIGTPGKISDCAFRLKLFNLAKIRVFVLDEADVMITMQGLRDQCISIHNQLSQKTQMLLFSATFEQEIVDFACHIVPYPIILRLLRQQETLDNVEQYYAFCKGFEEKCNFLKNIFERVSKGQVIVFCLTKCTVAYLTSKICSYGQSAAALSSDLTVEERLAVLDRFREGDLRILISTNVLSRGIDVVQVKIVINFELPVDGKRNADFETYLHRIGRTGRFGKKGIAISLVDSDETLAVRRAIEHHFKKPIKLFRMSNLRDLEETCSQSL